MPLEIEFEKNVLEGSTHEHHTFMNKDKLVFGTILLSVVDYLLHHVAHLRNAKETWDNLFITFEKQHVDNCYNYVYAIFKWAKTLQCKMTLTTSHDYKSTNISHIFFNEYLAFTLPKTLFILFNTHIDE